MRFFFKERFNLLIIIIFIVKIAKARKELNITSDVLKDIQDGKVNSDHQYINKNR